MQTLVRNLYQSLSSTDVAMLRVSSLAFFRVTRLPAIHVPVAQTRCSASSASLSKQTSSVESASTSELQSSSSSDLHQLEISPNRGGPENEATSKLAAYPEQTSGSDSQSPEGADDIGDDGDDTSSEAEREYDDIGDADDVEEPASAEASVNYDKPLPRGHPLFAMQSKRRVMGSPTLALEGVAISRPVQEAITQLMKASDMREKHYRARSNILQLSRAVETYKNLKRPTQHGLPVVLPPPDYPPDRALSYLCTRFPGTFAANVHVLSEIRRILPRFSPKSLLDFGAGVGTSLLAAERVLNSDSFAEIAKRNMRHSKSDLAHCVAHMPIKHAWLVDNAPAMKVLANTVLGAEHSISDVDVLHTKTLSDGPAKSQQYDLVIASYSLTEYIRSTMVRPDDDLLDEVQTLSRGSRGLKEKAAEVRTRRLIRTLWRRTAPGGLFVVVEDGTAAGFESVLFAREMVLNKFVNNDTAKLLDGLAKRKMDDKSGDVECARVVAPCVHSLKCPLDGSVTRRRVCRFEQRLNRPPFQRTAYPRFNAFEDEYFSFIAIQKLANSEQPDDNIHEHSWGRLVRAPLRRAKHISIDACTDSAKLERRVVSKRKAPEGYFARARRSKWGDIWPTPPSSKSSPVNF